MTTIAVKKFQNKIVMSSDTLSTGWFAYINYDTTKIFKVDDYAIVGFTGAMFNDFMKFIPQPNENEYDFCFALRTNLNEHISKLDPKELSQNRFWFIVAFKSWKIFTVQDNLEPYMVKRNYAAMWTWEDFAMWAMYAWLDPKDAVECSMRFDIHTGWSVETKTIDTTR